jgi:hypothetical protein
VTLPRRVGVRRLPQLAPEPFERPEAEWRRLGAPADLWDLQVAAAAQLAAHRAVLTPGEAGYPGPRWFLAHRWWRRHRPPFLAERDALTPVEAALMATWSRHDRVVDPAPTAPYPPS